MSARSTARDAFRLSVGTLTTLRVRPPQEVSRPVATAAMTAAPLVGVALGALAAGSLLVLRHLHSAPLLAATLTVGILAVMTRGLHLDGLADTADGLGSGKTGAGALTVMRRSDIGPFGVVTLVLLLLVEVSVVSGGPARLLLLAVVTGRAAVPLACRVGVRAARADGLGSAVAGSVPVAATVLVVALTVTLGAVLLQWQGAAAAAAGLLGAELLLQRCLARFDGVTGDVIGATVESAAAVTLVVWALLSAR